MCLLGAFLACEKEPRIPVERKPAAPKEEKPGKEAEAPVKHGEFAYLILKTETPQQMEIDTRVPILVNVKNTSNRVWPQKGSIKLGYYWTDQKGERIKKMEGRAPMRKEVEPGAIASLRPSVKTPLDPGKYFLVWDMIEENVAWFGSKGATPLRIPITIQ